MIDSTGTGQQWTAIQVTQSPPGKNGNNRATAVSDQPLNAAIPQGQTCTGTVAGQSNVCMVRCQNPARAGPFGGCVPVQMAGGNSTAAAGASPAAANPAPAATSSISAQAAAADSAAADAQEQD
jgi:Egh16-like virulence factor